MVESIKTPESDRTIRELHLQTFGWVALESRACRLTISFRTHVLLFLFAHCLCPLPHCLCPLPHCRFAAVLSVHFDVFRVNYSIYIIESPGITEGVWSLTALVLSLLMLLLPLPVPLSLLLPLPVPLPLPLLLLLLLCGRISACLAKPKPYFRVGRVGELERVERMLVASPAVFVNPQDSDEMFWWPVLAHFKPLLGLVAVAGRPLVAVASCPLFGG
jgi:hypothetical protein